MEQLVFCRNSLRNREVWEKRGFSVPTYNVEEVAEKAVEAPRWAHFGIGNIFRVFIAGIADDLIACGALDRGITCIETFDMEVVDRIYRPFDNLGLSVILKSDGSRDYRVLGSMAEAIKADCTDLAQWKRVMEVLSCPSLELISFTITEKGYALTKADGSWYEQVEKDLECGPECCTSAMAIVTAGLYKRYLEGCLPVALVSMDNCANNGRLLHDAVRTIAGIWVKKGFLEEGFLYYLEDTGRITFLCTMIDKITPRPSLAIAKDLEEMGLSGMEPVETAKRTYIAPFVNAEKPQYLVIEDHFPNGRPSLEKGFGVYMGDYATVSKAERMKVTALLNPVHSATGPLGVVLGIEGFAEMLHKVPVVLKMAKMVAYGEGLPMVKDPGILSPKAFVDELFEDRFPNEYLGDTNLRLSTDVSQGVGVRFGETIKTYVEKFGSAELLVAIPLGIASWIRYMMGIDDDGHPYMLAPDPMNEEFHRVFSNVVWGSPMTLTDQLRPILSNEKVFGVNLYEAGLGERIESYVREMIGGKGYTLQTIERYI